MLYVVLLLVLAALGLLVAALATGATWWAWASVAASVLAAGLLVADWVSRRRRAVQPTRPAGGTDPADREWGRTEPDDTVGLLAAVPLAGEGQRDASAGAGSLDRTDVVNVVAEVPADGVPAGAGALDQPIPADAAAGRGGGTDNEVGPATAAAPAKAATAADSEGEPGEEETDAADLLVVSELSAEVRVVDEHPRYHLANCAWVGKRPTLPLPVREARELGFTPCARCAPDAGLAARHRASRPR